MPTNHIVSAASFKEECTDLFTAGFNSGIGNKLVLTGFVDQQRVFLRFVLKHFLLGIRQPIIGAHILPSAHDLQNIVRTGIGPEYLHICLNGSRTYPCGSAAGKWSLGIGGHINPVDGLADNISTYLSGVEREIREEITFSGSAQQQLYAVINDDTNEVGSVHLGIVHRFDLESEHVSANEKALDNLGFRDLEELAGPLYEKLETWSAICVDALRQH